jgi:hypothetical protein
MMGRTALSLLCELKNPELLSLLIRTRKDLQFSPEVSSCPFFFDFTVRTIINSEFELFSFHFLFKERKSSWALACGMIANYPDIIEYLLPQCEEQDFLFVSLKFAFFSSEK